MTQLRGFAAMDEKVQREIASRGGKSQGRRNNPGNFANNPTRAARAGRIGGMRQGKDTNPGNFANNPKRAASAGRKGGQA